MVSFESKPLQWKFEFGKNNSVTFFIKKCNQQSNVENNCVETHIFSAFFESSKIASFVQEWFNVKSIAWQLLGTAVSKGNIFKGNAFNLFSVKKYPQLSPCRKMIFRYYDNLGMSFSIFERKLCWNY